MPVGRCYITTAVSMSLPPFKLLASCQCLLQDIGDEGAVVPGTSGPALYLAEGLNAFMHTRP